MDKICSYSKKDWYDEEWMEDLTENPKWHPVLRWMMDNIFVRTDPAGYIKPDKEKSTEKIDGAVVAVMALHRAVRNGGGVDSHTMVYFKLGMSSGTHIYVR